MKSKQPSLEASRLLLRPFRIEDGPTVQALAGRREISDVTVQIPYPYPDGAAEQWISTHQPNWEAGTNITFAITTKLNDVLIGAISLMQLTEIDAMLGYWIGVPYWRHGYCTEAAKEIVRFGLESYGLKRIHSNHLTRNPASGRVLQNAGLKYIRIETLPFKGAQEEMAFYELDVRTQ